MLGHMNTCGPYVISPGKSGDFLMKILILLHLVLPLVTKPIPNTCQNNTNIWQTLPSEPFFFSWLNTQNTVHLGTI